MALKAIQVGSQRFIAWIMVVASAVGLIAALVLTIEKMHLLQNPNAGLLCDINPIISCGSVMKTPQAMVFGFANSLIGIAAYAASLTVGVSILAGAQFKRWFWLLVQAGMVFGLVFVHWLFSQSVYRIGSLCPYCMVVWVSTITMGWYVTLYNLQNKYLSVPTRLRSVVSFANRHHGDILVAWLLIMAVLIVQRFWYYFGGLLQ